MQTRIMRPLRHVVALAALALAVPAACAGEMLAASDGRQEIVVFDSDDPGGSTRVVPLVGLAPGEQVLGLDARPLDGALYLLGSTSRVYVVDPGTGTATALGPGPFATLLNGRAFLQQSGSNHATD